MAVHQERDGALIALARKLDSIPQQSSERACTVILRDGSTRLGVTQVVQHMNNGGEFAGALFCRVSFRFAGQDSEFQNTFSSTHDVAWFIVDHKRGLVQFGPENGLQVRHRGLGIGSYIVGQLIRLLQGGVTQGNYRVSTFLVPMDVLDALPSDEHQRNIERIDSVFSRAGFYVSTAAGQRVVGARKAGDLRSMWNGEKIRFINPGLLIETTASALSEVSQNNHRIAVLTTDRDELEGRLIAAERDSLASATSLEEALEQRALLEQKSGIREAELLTTCQAYKMDIAELNKQLVSVREKLKNQAEVHKSISTQKAGDSATILVIELGKSTKLPLWSAIIALTFLACASLAFDVIRLS